MWIFWWGFNPTISGVFPTSYQFVMVGFFWQASIIITTSSPKFIKDFIIIIWKWSEIRVSPGPRFQRPMPYLNKYKDSAVRSTIEIHLRYLLQIQRLRSQKYKRRDIYGKSEGSCLRKYVQMLKCQCSECSLRIDCIVFLSSNNFPPGKVGQIVDTPDWRGATARQSFPIWAFCPA